MFAQDTFSANALDADDSGMVVTTIAHRDPDGITKDQISITEDGKNIPLASFTELDSIYEDKGQYVLILFENHKSRQKQNDYFAEVIENSAHRWCGEDDEFLFASFDWNRSDLGNKLLDFASFSETNEPDSLVSYAKNVKTRGGSYTRQSTMIYSAILEAIEYLEVVETDKPKAIVVLSGGYSDVFQHDVSDTEVAAKSLQANIPIYSVSRKIKGVADKYNLDGVCDDTYGLSSGLLGIDEQTTAAEYLTSFINQIGLRSAGKQYEISHKSSFEDCETNHDFQLTVGDSAPKNIIYSTQKCPGWLQQNMLLFIIMIVVGLGIIGLIFFFIRKNKKEREKSDAEHARKVKEIEDQNLAQQQEIEQQKAAMKHKEERDKIQQQQAQAEEQEAKRKEQEEEQISIMAQSGFPRLTGSFQGEYGELVIDRPHISIGRKDGNYYTINHNTVSGSHCEILFISGKYIIRDLNSSNGTLVNGVRISEQELNHGDVVSLERLPLPI